MHNEAFLTTTQWQSIQIIFSKPTITFQLFRARFPLAEKQVLPLQKMRTKFCYAHHLIDKFLRSDQAKKATALAPMAPINQAQEEDEVAAIQTKQQLK
jgi:hypothetical protein